MNIQANMNKFSGTISYDQTVSPSIQKESQEILASNDYQHLQTPFYDFNINLRDKGYTANIYTNLAKSDAKTSAELIDFHHALLIPNNGDKLQLHVGRPAGLSTKEFVEGLLELLELAYLPKIKETVDLEAIPAAEKPFALLENFPEARKPLERVSQNLAEISKGIEQRLSSLSAYLS